MRSARVLERHRCNRGPYDKTVAIAACVRSATWLTERWWDEWWQISNCKTFREGKLWNAEAFDLQASNELFFCEIKCLHCVLQDLQEHFHLMQTSDALCIFQRRWNRRWLTLKCILQVFLEAVSDARCGANFPWNLQRDRESLGAKEEERLLGGQYINK